MPAPYNLIKPFDIESLFDPQKIINTAYSLLQQTSLLKYTPEGFGYIDKSVMQVIADAFVSIECTEYEMQNQTFLSIQLHTIKLPCSLKNGILSLSIQDIQSETSNIYYFNMVKCDEHELTLIAVHSNGSTSHTFKLSGINSIEPLQTISATIDGELIFIVNTER